MDNKKAKYIGLDIGGTKILLQSFDEKLNKLTEKKVKTAKKSKQAFLAQLYELIDESFHIGIKGIGIAVPGIVDTQGVLVKAPHLPTGKNLKLKFLIEKRYNVKVHVTNDINAFLAAEYSRPNLKKYSNVIAVMVGTGVGGAAIVEGNMMIGKDGFAGEMGHTVIAKGSKKNTLEKLIGGAYTAKTLGKSSTAKKDLIKNLGIGLANLNLIFNPDAIVLGGSIYEIFVSKHKKPLERIIAKHSLAKKSPKLVDAGAKTSVCKGAVLLLQQFNATG